MGRFTVFLDIQGHLGHVQDQTQPGVGQEHKHPQGLIFGKVVEAKVVMDNKLGRFSVFPDIQGHLGHVQDHRQPGVGQEQGHPQGLIF